MSEMGLIQGATCLMGYRAPLTMCDEYFARICWGGEYKHKTLQPAPWRPAPVPRARVYLAPSRAYPAHTVHAKLMRAAYKVWLGPTCR